ncbi:hypothetical protein H5410_008761 [Solanum commersonii]|uniref:Uncharacterized protein n=1 Tax=Solanum commersonii TaxID=4109 RepID=A0A9J6AHP2_SOLCO|nr:hypothetical protein H5410_008761 [Solanum commersonii]
MKIRHSDNMALQVCGHHIQPSKPQNDTASDQERYCQHQRTGYTTHCDDIYLHLTQKANESYFLWFMLEYIRVEEKEKQLYLGLALDFWWFTKRPNPPKKFDNITLHQRIQLHHNLGWKIDRIDGMIDV